jgi:hypothetical protein
VHASRDEIITGVARRLPSDPSAHQVQSRSDGGKPVNAKRVYRLMKKHGPLLTRHTGRRRPREHYRSLVNPHLDLRGCSNSLEFIGRIGDVVRVASTWIATTGQSLIGSPPRPAPLAR